MADQDLQKPRSKVNTKNHVHESPFPVPIASLTGKPASKSRWYYYFAQLKCDHVAVFRLGDLTFLYRLGFFGKGILSRSRAQFELYNDVLLEEKHHVCLSESAEKKQEMLRQHQVQKERLRQHSIWAGNELVEEGTDFHVLQPSPDDKHPFLDSMANDDPMQTDQSCTVSNSIGEKRKFSQDESACEKSIKLQDPYKIYEYLQLTLEEAFFLKYGFGCLDVQDGKQHSMSVREMWSAFIDLKAEFVERYIAYHHFRSKGWVVRFGNIYGGDFLLYKDGMPFYHASYSVIVQMVDQETLSPTRQTPFTWKQLVTVSRVCEKVSKEVLFCYVVRPSDMSDQEMKTINSIKRFKVMEVLLRRWIPEKHREAKGCS